MNWKKIISLAFLFILCAWYLLGQNPQAYKSGVIKLAVLARAPASIKKVVVDKDKPFSELEKSGLTKVKVAAILQLQEFHFSNPAFTEENMRKREIMLNALFDDSQDTVSSFSKLMLTSKDDGLKGFLLNLTMTSQLDDEDKAEIFVARLKAGANISKEGLVPDEQISFMLGISHLSRLENQAVKEHAQEQLKQENLLNKNVGFKSIYKDYFNEPL
jgi:hypothetical protein